MDNTHVLIRDEKGGIRLCACVLCSIPGSRKFCQGGSDYYYFFIFYLGGGGINVFNGPPLRNNWIWVQLLPNGVLYRYY